VALLDRLLVPGGRWLLRRRVNRAIDEINRRLRLRIRPFKLTRRAVLIDRLTFDPRVVEAAGGHVYVPRTDEEYATVVRLRALLLRRLVEERDGVFAVVPAEVPVLRYYANSIRHLLPEEV
jgi:hypothetical protein